MASLGLEAHSIFATASDAFGELQFTGPEAGCIFGLECSYWKHL